MSDTSNLSMLLNPLETIENVVWSDKLDNLGPVLGIVREPLRYLYAVVRDIFDGELTLRAMSLVYTTLLSIVPLLAFSFAMLKGFGVFEELEPKLALALEPLGDKGAEITRQIMGLVENVKGGVLGGASLAILLWTVISTIQKVESSFNYVWYVNKPRSMARRVTEYIVVLVIGPVLMVSAITIISSMSSNDVVNYLRDLPGIGDILIVAGKLVPILLISGVFTFLYMFMPNTRVSFMSALVGGIGGGLMWATMAIIFTEFVATAARTQSIYANFAVAISALIWLYLNWLVLLIGAQLAFYHQNPAFRRVGRQEIRLSNSMRERLALSIMMMVGQAFRKAGTHITLRDIGARLYVPTIGLIPIITALEENHLLLSTEDESLVPGREMSRIRLQDILDVVRAEGATGYLKNPTWHKDIVSLGDELDGAMNAVVKDRSLADLLDSIDKA